MTGDRHDAADPRGLWPTLSSLAIGSNPAAFERRLAADNGWSEAFACRVIDEYRRFLCLASAASFEVTPSKAVDAAWHLHLEDEADYRHALCERLLGRVLEHRPGTGEAAEEHRFRDQYRRTLALYESTFGAPPADIGPRPEEVATDAEGWWPSDRWWAVGSGAALTGTLLVALVDAALVYVALGLLLALLICWAITRASAWGRRRRGRDLLSCGSPSFGDGDCGETGCGGGCGGD